MKSRTLIAVFIVFAAVIGTVIYVVFPREQEDIVLTPHEARRETTDQPECCKAGTGWSISEDPAVAVKGAAAMAMKNIGPEPPDFAVLYASSGSDLSGIHAAARKTWGDRTQLFGGTSDSRAVITDKGFVRATKRGYSESLKEGKRGLAVMAVSSEHMQFGTGSADCSDPETISDCAEKALVEAIQNAGKNPDELPRLILLTPTLGIEEEVLEGINRIAGKEVPVLGGTTGGPTHGVFGNDTVHEKGVSVAVLYTDLPMGWTFEGGFDVRNPHSGIATEVDGQAIVEIDNRPALDVYNEWLDGKIDKLFREVGRPDVIRDLLTLHPIYRKYTSPDGKDYFLFSHPWPEDDTLKDRSVMTSTKIKEGERIYLSHGTWETFVSRIGNLPKHAKIHGNIGIDTKPLLSMGYICGGVMGTIPDDERGKLPVLINYANNDAPFIANFTWGEQGCFPGVGNKHGNLLTSFIVVGHPESIEK